MSDDWLVTLATFGVYRSQLEEWKHGTLQRAWATRFPELFDGKDQALARSQGPDGYHFAEWLGAITVLHLTGFLSLVAKYEFQSHARKVDLARQLLPEPVRKLVFGHKEYGGTQCPDLLAHTADMSDFFFCEVKGPGDRLSPRQRGLFQELALVSGKPIRLIRFHWHS